MNLPTTTQFVLRHSSFLSPYPLSSIPYPLLTPSTAKSWTNRKPAPKNLPPSSFILPLFFPCILSPVPCPLHTPSTAKSWTNQKPAPKKLRPSSFSIHTAAFLPLYPVPCSLSPQKALREKLPPKNLVFPEKFAIPLPRASANPQNPRGKHHRALWKNSKKPENTRSSRSQSPWAR
jgi:hypothetical protein